MLDTTWKVKKIESKNDFDPGILLPQLANNDIPAIQIANFYSPDVLDTIVKNIFSQGILWYQNFEYKQGRIGVCATEYYSKLNGKAAYFALEPEHSRIRENIFSTTLDPVNKLIELFSISYKTNIAREPTMGNLKYFSGIIRAMQQKSTAHFDYATHQLPGWWVSNMEAQFGIVIYLQMPELGGELTIYNRPWIPEDDKYNQDVEEKGPKGFDEGLLKNVPSTTITPHVGDVIIFSTRNFHQVDGINSDTIRLTCNSFVSLKDNKLYLWS